MNETDAVIGEGKWVVYSGGLAYHYTSRATAEKFARQVTRGSRVADSERVCVYLEGHPGPRIAVYTAQAGRGRRVAS